MTKASFVLVALFCSVIWTEQQTDAGNFAAPVTIQFSIDDGLGQNSEVLVTKDGADIGFEATNTNGSTVQSYSFSTNSSSSVIEVLVSDVCIEPDGSATIELDAVTIGPFGDFSFSMTDPQSIVLAPTGLANEYQGMVTGVVGVADSVFVSESLSGNAQITILTLVPEPRFGAAVMLAFLLIARRRLG